MMPHDSNGKRAQPCPLPPQTEAELEIQAIRELETMERARNAKRSGYAPKRRRWDHADRG